MTPAGWDDRSHGKAVKESATSKVRMNIYDAVQRFGSALNFRDALHKYVETRHVPEGHSDADWDALYEDYYSPQHHIAALLTQINERQKIL